MDRGKTLQSLPLLGRLSDESRSALADICIEKILKRKDILFWEGDKGYSLYILLKGRVQLTKSAPDGRETVIRIIKPNEMFAEVILFEKKTYPVTATVLEDGEAFLIPRHQFLCLLENASFRDEFIAGLMGKMRYLTDRIEYLTSHDVEERLFHFFREQFGSQNTFRCRLSKKEVAAAVSTTPETLSRILQRLKRENRLMWEGSRVQIKTPGGYPDKKTFQSLEEE